MMLVSVIGPAQIIALLAFVVFLVFLILAVRLILALIRYLNSKSSN